MNPTLAFLLSPLCTGALAPEHRADIEKSGITADTIARHAIRSVPPDMIDRLLDFFTPHVVSAYVIPFAAPAGGWMPHIRLRVFPAYTDRRGRSAKYLGRRGAPPRLYFPIPTMSAVLGSDAPVWLLEGAKKALAVMQLGLAAVGFEGVEGWHRGGSTELLDDFAAIPLAKRRVELVPDGDVSSNAYVTRGIARFAEALTRRGAVVRVRLLA